MTENAKRYFDLKADYNQAEVNVQEDDRTMVVTGPVAVDANDSSRIAALEQSPAIKSITLDEYANATDFSKLTVAQLDDRFGETEGYPVGGNKDAKVAFAKATAGNVDNEEDES